MYRFFLIFLPLIVALESHAAIGGRVLELPCERPLLVLGVQSALGKAGPADRLFSVVDRLETAFRHVCGNVVLESRLLSEGGVTANLAEMEEVLSEHPGAVAIVHFPHEFASAGRDIEKILDAYRRLLAACGKWSATCIIGGQIPTAAFAPGSARGQASLELQAKSALGRNYLPLYRYFESESPTRRLTISLDRGDGRGINDRGHELLYQLYGRRLLELTRARDGSSHPASVPRATGFGNETRGSLFPRGSIP